MEFGSTTKENILKRHEKIENTYKPLKIAVHNCNEDHHLKKLFVNEGNAMN